MILELWFTVYFGTYEDVAKKRISVQNEQEAEYVLRHYEKMGNFNRALLDGQPFPVKNEQGET